MLGGFAGRSAARPVTTSSIRSGLTAHGLVVALPMPAGVRSAAGAWTWTWSWRSSQGRAATASSPSPGHGDKHGGRSGCAVSCPLVPVREPDRLVHDVPWPARNRACRLRCGWPASRTAHWPTCCDCSGRWLWRNGFSVNLCRPGRGPVTWTHASGTFMARMKAVSGGAWTVAVTAGRGVGHACGISVHQERTLRHGRLRRGGPAVRASGSTEELVEDIAPKRHRKEGHVRPSRTSRPLPSGTNSGSHPSRRHTPPTPSRPRHWPAPSPLPPVRLFNPDIEAMTRRALHLALEDYARSSGREGPGPARSPDTSMCRGRETTGRCSHSPRRVVRPGGTGPACRPCTSCPDARGSTKPWTTRSTCCTARQPGTMRMPWSSSPGAMTCPPSPTPVVPAPPRRTSLDEWLFPAVFGEGAGALVIGHTDSRGGDWAIEGWGSGPVAGDWRVTMPSDQSTPHMVIRARCVGATYRTHIPRTSPAGTRRVRRSAPALPPRILARVHVTACPVRPCSAPGPGVRRVVMTTIRRGCAANPATSHGAAKQSATPCQTFANPSGAP